MGTSLTTSRAGVALCLAVFLTIAALFLILNRAAYKGYFQDDELDNISWTPHVNGETWIKGFLSPRLDRDNFRPTGHLYFDEMARHFGLDFPKYLVPVHLIHLLNALLIALLARTLKAGWVAALTAAAFFALNVAVFDAYWKPMYVFDVLCAFFCLLSMLLFAQGRWILSLIAFWLAYKSKELAVMLPMALALYEFWFGERRFKRLVPFFLISLSFGLQGILLNPAKDNAYTFRFNLQSLQATVPFYASRLLLIPYGGLAILALAVLRDRRIWFGVATLCLFFFPLLFLPGRLYPAYCYVPLTGAAVALAGLVSIGERAHWRPLIPAVLLAFAIWIPWNIRELRIDRAATLGPDDETRTFVSGIRKYAQAHPDPAPFIYDAAPAILHHWGVTAAVHIAYDRLDVPVFYSDTVEGQQALRGTSLILLDWDTLRHRVRFNARYLNTKDASYIAMGEKAPVWQLISGWLGGNEYFQWIQPKATAYLQRPANARRFELFANVSPELIRKLKRTSVTVSLDGTTLGETSFTEPGHHRVEWQLPAGAPGKTQVDFQVVPAFHPERDSRNLGIAVIAFGFLPREES
ncbi:MAG: hypothetical protein M3Z85_09285 [Acidobacteriota bacterium]|nr:hypothetical protein [Acidobacteriota bacterium]